MCQCGPHFISRVARYRSRAKSGVRLYLTHADSCRLQADPYSACNTGESCATAGDTDLAIEDTNFTLRLFARNGDRSGCETTLPSVVLGVSVFAKSCAELVMLPNCYSLVSDT